MPVPGHENHTGHRDRTGRGRLVRRRVMASLTGIAAVALTVSNATGSRMPRVGDGPGGPRIPRPRKPGASTDVYLASLPPYLVESEGRGVNAGALGLDRERVVTMRQIQIRKPTK